MTKIHCLNFSIKTSSNKMNKISKIKMFPQRLIYLDTWSSVDGTLGEELEDMALLEMVCDKGGFRFQKLILFLISFFCLTLVDQM